MLLRCLFEMALRKHEIRLLAHAHRCIASRRSLATSAFAEAYLKKAAVAAADKQLSFIPEFAKIQTTVPHGRFQCLNSAGGKSSTTCVSAGTDASRVIEICQSMGSTARNTFLEAALRRSIARAECCGDFATALKNLTALTGQYRSLTSDLDSLDGASRTDIAEAFLALARLHVAGARSSAALGHASKALAASSEASSVSDELIFAQSSGDVSAVAALLPAALSHARAHALAILVNKLLKGIDTVEEHAAPTDPEAADKDSPSPPGSRPQTVEAAHLEQVIRACQAADEAITRIMQATGPQKDSSAMTARYVHGRTALIRSSARRNLAAVHILKAHAHMLASSASGAGSGTGIPLNAQYALAHLSTAHEQLTAALEQVNLACTRHRDISDALLRPAAGTEGTGQVTQAVSQSISPAWSRLGWDLRAARADIAASTAEVGTLLALWTVWMPGALGAGQGSGTGRAQVPKAIFPLDEQEADAVASVVKTASAAAEASLRDYEAIQAAMSTGAVEGTGLPLPALSDHGLDPACGMARALRAIAMLQHYTMKSVTAEGLFRAALDKCESVSIVPMPGPSDSSHAEPAPEETNSSSASLGGLETSARRWQISLPAMFQAGVAGILLPYGALLAQWDKRERESARITELGRALLAGPCTAFGLSATSAHATQDNKIAYVTQQALVVGLSTAHVGSWGMTLPYDYNSV